MSSSMSFKERPIILTDFETTGLDPFRHEIIDIGAIKVTHNLQEIERLDIKVRPDSICTAEPKALEINGYNEEEWETALSSVAAAVLFQGFAATGVLAAWNITFEYTFMQQMFKKTRIFDPLDYHRIDIPSIAWMLIPELKYLSMDAVGKHFNMKPEATPHRGIRGAAYELEILRYLKGLTI